MLISARRLHWLGFDRPAGALLGAVACVLVGALTPAQALAAIDGSTLLLLFGVMGMGAFLAVDGVFTQLEQRLLLLARGSPKRLLAWVVWTAGPASALITNDAVCLLGAPVLVGLLRREKLPPLPYLLALATAANTGSVATLVGNPQNMLCASLCGLDYWSHLLKLAPVAVVGLLINHAILLLSFRRQLAAASLSSGEKAPALSGRSRLSLLLIAATVPIYTLGADLAWTATAGFVALMLLHRRDTRELWSRIDWSLLLFFAALFVVVEAFTRSGAPAAFFHRVPLQGSASALQESVRSAGLFLLGSNVVSNVPFILVIRPQMATLAEPTLGWELLAMASTFAGNLTLLGSVANIIVAEAGRDLGGIGFLQHLRVGLPLAIITTLLGTLWLAL
ncbi:MAG: hypothetical protein KC457_01020 [Myxococcales bacterium]|nr:hypothetical protein [Myxococcales bacterium]